jgi:DNA-binding transcriptional ArsR family regulator
MPVISDAAPANLDLQQRLLLGLGDRSRLAIVSCLLGAELRVSDIVEATGLSQPNVSKHLACLWGCGLVAREKRGREVYYRPIEGVEELFVAVEGILARAGETIGSCPLTAEVVAAA